MTIPHYGKRNPGGLTASSPGDSLFFSFASYNDSGDSEALSGFAVSDVEVFKNGDPTARATDSGYSLISDTGMMGDRVGLYRFRVQVFNTTDDTGFYDVGSWYQVAVDVVSIDGKNVRFWAGSFEVGEPRANLVQIDGDTGFADRLGKLASLLSAVGQIDTGTISGRLPANVQQIAGDTGAAAHVQQAFAAQSTNSDTGLIANAAAIKAKTDSITFTVAGVVDANIQRVNDVEVGGTGADGNEWGPA
jgi:hypothetical protein